MKHLRGADSTRISTGLGELTADKPPRRARKEEEKRRRWAGMGLAWDLWSARANRTQSQTRLERRRGEGEGGRLLGRGMGKKAHAEGGKREGSSCLA